MFGSMFGAMGGMFGGGHSPKQPQAAGNPEGASAGQQQGGLFQALLSRAQPSQTNSVWARFGMQNPNQQPPQQGPPMGTPPQPSAGPSVPAVPPNPPSRVPPAVDRFTNGQQIQQAFANGWNPNPVLLRAALGK